MWGNKKFACTVLDTFDWIKTLMDNQQSFPPSMLPNNFCMVLHRFSCVQTLKTLLILCYSTALVSEKTEQEFSLLLSITTLKQVILVAYPFFST